MKKRAALWAAMLVLALLAGCGAIPAAKMDGARSGGEPPSSSMASAPGPAPAAASAAENSSRTAASSAAPSESCPAYSVKPVSVRYQKDGNDLSAEFPQLQGNIIGNDPKTVYNQSEKNSYRYNKVNAFLENEALSTICSVQVNSDPHRVTSKTVGRTVFSSENFVSAVFESSFKAADSGHTFQTLRAVNYDLKADRAVTEKDLFVANNNFYKAVDTAVKKQLSKKYQEYFTSDVIWDGIDKASVYFTKDQIVVSLVTGLELNDHVEITLLYEETSGFRTKNAVWSYLGT